MPTDVRESSLQLIALTGRTVASNNADLNSAVAICSAYKKTVKRFWIKINSQNENQIRRYIVWFWQLMIQLETWTGKKDNLALML